MCCLLVGWLVGWLVVCLVGWLVGWLFVCLFVFVCVPARAFLGFRDLGCLGGLGSEGLGLRV